ncbi:MAG: DMT family transporter [Acidimicrobiia bacterium]
MRLKHWTLLLIAAFGWGAGGVITRAAFNEGLDPVGFSAYRSAVAAIVVLSYRLARRGRLGLGRRAWRAGAVLGTINLAVPFLLLTIAVSFASAGFVGLLVANIPIGTAVWAHLLGEEKIDAPRAVGLGVALSGVMLLLLSGDSGLDEGGNPTLAIGLSLIGLAFASYSILFAKRATATLDPVSIAGPQFVVGTGLLLLLVPFTDGVPSEVTTAGWALVVAAGLLSTALPFLVFYTALPNISATQASLVGYVVPLVSIVLGVAWLDERVTAAIAAGGALILGGIVLADRAAAQGRPAPTITGQPE